MTQQNAALVEEASAAGEAMAEQARSMNTMMDFFNTDGGSTESAPARSLHVVSSGASSTPVSISKSVGAKGPASDDEWEEF
jgi:methyl-accepting chemotaxis protein